MGFLEEHLKQRDEINTSGTNPGDGQSADVNPDFVGRTLLDNLNNSDTTPGNGSSSFLNPDFNPTELSVNEQFPPGAFPQITSRVRKGWNILAYLGPEELVGTSNVVDYFLQYFPTLPQSDTKSDMERLAGVVDIIKNNEGLFIWPEFGFDGLGKLVPGQGYQIRLRDNPLKPNGQPLNMSSYPLILSHNITRYFDIPDFSTYLNKIQNFEIEGIHTGYNTIGFVRFIEQPTREATYKLFFPDGSDGHILNDEGLPYDSTHPADILGFIPGKFHPITGDPIEYQTSKNGSTGSFESIIHNIYAHPTDTGSVDTTLFRITLFDAVKGGTYNFRAMDDSLFPLHNDILYQGTTRNDDEDNNNLYHFKAGSNLLEGVTNLAEKISDVFDEENLPTSFNFNTNNLVTFGFPMTSSVIVDNSDIKLKINMIQKEAARIEVASSSFGSYLNLGIPASGEFNPGTIPESNTIFKFEVGSEEYLFKGFRVSSSAEQDARDVYNNVDNQFAFNTSQTPNNVLDREDPENHNISSDERIANFIDKVNEQNLVKVNFTTVLETDSNGDFIIDDFGSGIIDYSLIFVVARNTTEDFNGIKIKKSINNGVSYTTKTTLDNGVITGFFEIGELIAGKGSWFTEIGFTNQLTHNSLIDRRLGDFIDIIKNNEGLFYWPSKGFDGLGAYEPGQGYQLRIKDLNNYVNSGNETALFPYRVDPREELTFPLSSNFPQDGLINTDPLIDGGPE